MPRKNSELHFHTNRSVTEFMRDNGVDEQELRKEYALSARYGYWCSWSAGTTGYSVTHDGEKYIIRVSEEN